MSSEGYFRPEIKLDDPYQFSNHSNEFKTLVRVTGACFDDVENELKEHCTLQSTLTDALGNLIFNQSYGANTIDNYFEYTRLDNGLIQIKWNGRKGTQLLPAGYYSLSFSMDGEIFFMTSLTPSQGWQKTRSPG